jgi:hypothetical protein
MKARRVAFAVPFVITVACDRRAQVREPTPDVEEREAREDRVVVDLSPREPTPAPVPYQLVDELRPLGARPAPSTTPADRYPDSVGPVTKSIREIQRGVVHTRVHVHRAPRVDDSWRVTFVTREKIEKGECTIVEWDTRVVECTTDLTPEQLVNDGDTLMAQLIPPAELVTEVQQAQWEWQQRPPRCCTNPPPPRPPTGNPPPPMRARVLRTDVQGDRTIVTVGRGSQDGVGKTWTANLVDGNDKLIPNGTCVIIRIEKRTTVCALKVTPDQVDASPFVRLSNDR